MHILSIYWVLVSLFCLSIPMVKSVLTSTFNDTKCSSLYPVQDEERYKCHIKYIDSTGNSIEMSLKFHHCKSPHQATIYKKTTRVSTSSVFELTHLFTPKDNYFGQIKEEEVALLLEFLTMENSDQIRINVFIVRADKRTSKLILSSLFPTDKSDCTWFETLGDKQKVGFIAGMTVLLGILLTTIAIAVGIRLKKKYLGRKLQFSPYCDREPLQLHERKSTFVLSDEKPGANSTAGLISDIET